MLIGIPTPANVANSWRAGPNVFIDPVHIIAVQPDFRPSCPHPFAKVYLSTGLMIDVYASAGQVAAKVAQAEEDRNLGPMW